jgi:hypothetical protein
MNVSVSNGLTGQNKNTSFTKRGNLSSQKWSKGSLNLTFSNYIKPQLVGKKFQY